MKDSSGLGPRTMMTHVFDDRIEAESFVERRWEPSDEKTRVDLLEFARALGVAPTGHKGQLKVVRCLSDLCKSIRASKNGLIAWQTGSDDMSGRPYGRDTALKIKGALEDKGYLVVEQEFSWALNLARVYKVNKSICQDHYKFKQHYSGWFVEVRTEKVRDNWGQVSGGVPMRRALFKGKIESLEAEMRKINNFTEKHPLKSSDGRELVGCKRIFNNGSLKSGGRLYGDWQNLKGADRLNLKIDEEQLCEIDIKACFLSIAYAGFGGEEKLMSDPYMAVKFVRECNDPVRRKQLRDACKKLVAAFLCKKENPKKKTNRTQFPKGEWCKVTKKVIPFREAYGLTEDVDFYMNQIMDAFPFLQQQKVKGKDLMYQESTVMVKAMLALIELSVPAYPVHDCLIVKLKDKDRAVGALTEAMEEVLKYVPSMDVSYLNKNGEVACDLIQQPSSHPISGDTNIGDDQVMVVGDGYDLIEDWGYGDHTIASSFIQGREGQSHIVGIYK